MNSKNANKARALSFVLAFALVLQIFALPFTVSAATSDTVIDGLTKLGGKTYYYKKGVMAKNEWVTTEGHTYYFGKNGEAYKGYKKIGKDRYYFDKNGRMAIDKTVKINGKKYYFMSDGKAPKYAVMIKKKIWKTSSGGKLLKNISSLAKAGKDFAPFRKAAGKPVKTDTMPSCLGSGNDVNYTYDNFVISTHQTQDSQKILAAVPLSN